MALQEFTMEDVAVHNSSDSLWLVIEGMVYDVTNFINEHPGGPEVLLDNAGKDATTAFQDIGHSQDAINLRKNYLIGVLKEAVPEPTPGVTPKPPTQQQTRSVCSCCGSEHCRGWMIGGAGAVLVAAVAIGLGIFLYKRYHK